eukprot:TRINITY_DN15567_c0_g2_i2.p1 TRINITY_DN15567_c0_g2~~TRINITY_DN15567_c0_g2_i2.p1  ORF type:complete len:388 (+),score=16.60 TRINITY_DN15567_c0_g2_i2:150-1166(+)
MEAARRCQAASRRLGYYLRRSSVAHSRRELRTAQQAVDDSRSAILAAVQMGADMHTGKQLGSRLAELIRCTPAAERDGSVMHQKDNNTQTDHLLRRHVHALTSSKGTDNPKHDLVDTFELRLMVAGPELDNSAGVVACSNPAIRSKITVQGINLCFGELLWTSKQLNTGSTVECKLSTAEVLTMSRRISAARGIFVAHKADQSLAKDCDDAASEVSTATASSLSRSVSAAEASGTESEHTSRSRASQGELAQRRFARARRPARELPDGRGNEVDVVNGTGGAGNALPTVAEEKRSRPLTATGRRITAEEADTLHNLLQKTQLKTYTFTHSLEWYIRPL